MPKQWKQTRPPVEEPIEQANPHESKIYGAELSGNAHAIDLHGLDVQSGIHTLEIFLHSAFMGDHEVVKIIHGRGTGKMRDAIRNFLKSEPLVAFFRDSNNVTEMSGVTFAVLVKSSA